MPRSISYSVVGSTQEVAIRLAKEGAPHGTSVTAETQLLGHGRQGRPWVSPKGGLYSSVVVRPEPPAFPLLSLAVGLELRQLLTSFVPRAHVTIKWPNDLLLSPLEGGRTPRKAGGVLTDIITVPGIRTFAVVGVGLNITCNLTDFPPDLQEHVACLREYAEAPLSARELQDPVLEAVTRACTRVSSVEGRQSLPTALQPHLFGLGRPVSIDGSRGTFQGVGPEGEALVQLEGGGPPRAMHAGELSIEVP